MAAPNLNDGKIGFTYTSEGAIHVNSINTIEGTIVNADPTKLLLSLILLKLRR